MKKNKTLSYYWRFARQDKKLLSGILFCNALGTILGFIVIPLIGKYFIDTLINFSGDQRSDIYPQLLWFWIWWGALDLLAFAVLGRINDFLFSRYVITVMDKLYNFCFQNLHRHSYAFFANHFVGSLVSRTHRFTQGFMRIADVIQWNVFPRFFIFTISIGVVWYFTPLIGAIIATWMILFFTVVFWATRKWKIPFALKASSQWSTTTGRLADTISNATAVKMFSRGEHEGEGFQDVSGEFRVRVLRSWNATNYLNIFQAAFMAVLQIVVLYVIIQQWMGDQISVGTIVLIQSYLIQIYMDLWGFGRVIRDYYETMSDAQEMTDILEAFPEIQDPPDPEPSRIHQGDIRFEGVSFSYERKTDVFEQFDLHIPAGQKIGLVGESGAGKTTITKLLLRFVDIQSGDITVDGQSIYRITQDELRRSISFVPQEPVLFHRTLFENIQYGDLSATKEQIIAAAKKAHAHEFILRTPNGYDTLVGERGVKLSGGERQRVAIARAMLKKAPILILDEATSSLDSRSEKHIQQALEELMRGKTTLVIAHRLSTLRKMDKICVIDKGQIVAFDTHDHLLAQGGKYAELWNHQSGGFIE